MKESLTAKEHNRLLFRETFQDDQSVRRNGGTPTGITFSNGVGEFNGTSSNIIYLKQFNGTCSVCINLTGVSSFVNLDYLADFRGNGGASYLRILTGTPFTIQAVGGGTVYVDGVATTTITNTSKQVVVSGISLNGSLTIGSYYTGGGSWIETNIDLFKIYNYTLSAEEVLNLYNNRTRKDVIAPEFMNISSDKGGISDRFGIDIVNTDTDVIKAYDTMVMDFNGSTSKLYLGSNALIGDLSFVCWFNARGLGGGSAGRFIDNGQFYARIVNTSRVAITSNNSTLRYAKVNTFPINQWNLLVITRPGDGSAVQIYANAVLDTATTGSDAVPVSGTDTYIGVNTGGLANDFDGLMNGIRLYNGILTAEEVFQIYTNERAKYHG
jgi:hypothetical protein